MGERQQKPIPASCKVCRRGGEGDIHHAAAVRSQPAPLRRLCKEAGDREKWIG